MAMQMMSIFTTDRRNLSVCSFDTAIFINSALLPHRQWTVRVYSTVHASILWFQMVDLVPVMSNNGNKYMAIISAALSVTNALCVPMMPDQKHMYMLVPGTDNGTFHPMHSCAARGGHSANFLSFCTPGVVLAEVRMRPCGYTKYGAASIVPTVHTIVTITAMVVWLMRRFVNGRHMAKYRSMHMTTYIFV
jgi:hypothetical protein